MFNRFQNITRKESNNSKRNSVSSNSTTPNSSQQLSSAQKNGSQFRTSNELVPETKSPLIGSAPPDNLTGALSSNLLNSNNNIDKDQKQTSNSNNTLNEQEQLQLDIDIQNRKRGKTSQLEPKTSKFSTNQNNNSKDAVNGQKNGNSNDIRGKNLTDIEEEKIKKDQKQQLQQQNVNNNSSKSKQDQISDLKESQRKLQFVQLQLLDKKVKPKIEKFVQEIEDYLLKEDVMDDFGAKDGTETLSKLLLKHPDYFEYFIDICIFPQELGPLDSNNTNKSNLKHSQNDYQKNKTLAMVASEAFKIGLNKQVLKLLFKKKNHLMEHVLSILQQNEIENHTYSLNFNHIMFNVQKVREKDFWEYFVKNGNFIIKNLIKHIKNNGICDYIFYLLDYDKIDKNTETIKYNLMQELLARFFIQQEDDSLELQNIQSIFVNFLGSNKLQKLEIYNQIAEKFLFNEIYMDQFILKLETTTDQFNVQYIASVINYTYVFFYFKMDCSMKKYILQLVDILKQSIIKIDNKSSQNGSSKNISNIKQNNYKKQQTQFKENITPLGPGKLQIMELFENFFRAGNKLILNEIANTDFFDILNQLMVQYEWNNLLHQYIERIYILGLRSNNTNIIESMMYKYKLSEFIIDRFRQKNIYAVIQGKIQDFHKAYIGCLAHIGFTLLETNNAKIEKALSQNKKWKGFTNDKLSLLQNIFKKYKIGNGIKDQNSQASSYIESTDTEDPSKMYQMKMSKSEENLDTQLSLKKSKIDEPEEDDGKIEFVCTEYDENDIQQIFINIAMEGCGRRGYCSNQYCLHNPVNNRITYQEVEDLIENGVLDEFQSCDEVEKNKISEIPDDYGLDEIEWNNQLKAQKKKEIEYERHQSQSMENPPLNSIKLSLDPDYKIYSVNENDSELENGSCVNNENNNINLDILNSNNNNSNNKQQQQIQPQQQIVFNRKKSSIEDICKQSNLDQNNNIINRKNSGSSNDSVENNQIRQFKCSLDEFTIIQ